ncbi:MAG TPA: hypothetical protein VNW72_00600 [Chthoniobacterales bacterium]|jgi:hypothetical protein|nr:hypothetical protein [Chthoniobacterales bacterium]
MKKLFPVSLIAFGGGALTFLAGCMATQNRWEAAQMRQQVMDYYNDQIMENLIRAKVHLPFVHVDVTSLTTTDAASLTGVIGSGETPSFSRTSPSSTMATALHTITRGVTRPFSYSVTPSRNTSLQILASPALGTLPGDSGITSKTTKKTETTESDPKNPTKSVKTTTEEEIQNSKSKPNTIYALYEQFVGQFDQDVVKDKDKGFCHAQNVGKDDYVPGTKKRWGNEYFYIKNEDKFRIEYYNFCKKLFTKGPASSVQGAIQSQANAAVQAAELH